jgi:hypothetical protein
MRLTLFVYLILSAPPLVSDILSLFCVPPIYGSGYILGAGSVSSALADRQMLDMGLVFGAAYTIFDVREVRLNYFVYLEFIWKLFVCSKINKNMRTF